MATLSGSLAVEWTAREVSVGGECHREKIDESDEGYRQHGHQLFRLPASVGNPLIHYARNGVFDLITHDVPVSCSHLFVSEPKLTFRFP